MIEGKPLTAEMIRECAKTIRGISPCPFGFNIIESGFMVEEGEPYEKLRTLKERVFSRPWKPFKKTKTIIPKIPSRNIVKIMTTNTLVMHPVVAAELRQQIDIYWRSKG